MGACVFDVDTDIVVDAAALLCLQFLPVSASAPSLRFKIAESILYITYTFIIDTISLFLPIKFPHTPAIATTAHSIAIGSAPDTADLS